MPWTRSILVGIDYSRHSRAALAQAARLAIANRADLHVLHVAGPPRMSAGAGPLREELARVESVATAATQSLVRDWMGSLKLPAAQLHVEVRIGSAFRELLLAVAERKADLLVLGACGTTPAREVGALAAKCVRKAPTRVLLVRRYHRHAFRKVVACADFSGMTRRVATLAAQVAAAESAGLHIVHVLPPVWGALDLYEQMPAAAVDLERLNRESAAMELEKLAEGARRHASEVAVRTKVLNGVDPAASVADFARKSRADLVVLATHGRAGLRVLQMGTTAERIIRRSPCSILAIKPPSFRYEVD